MVAEPCHTRGAPAKGRGRVATKSSGARNSPDQVTSSGLPKPVEKFVLLGQQVPLVFEVQPEHREVPDLVALPDDQFKPAAYGWSMVV